MAALAEPVRRRLYEFVARAGEPVDRDTAASGTGIGRPLAAFHLDRLVTAGLLDVVFRRRNGRSGPGAGRPAKFYMRPDDRETSVQLPARGYDVAADILAAGIERDRDHDAQRAVLEAARERGATMAAEGPRELLPLLETAGYEPYTEADGTVRLRNCPFHVLVGEHRDLTCSMNLALLRGATEAIDDPRLRPVAAPGERRCCVAFVADEPGRADEAGADASLAQSTTAGLTPV